MPEWIFEPNTFVSHALKVNFDAAAGVQKLCPRATPSLPVTVLAGAIPSVFCGGCLWLLRLGMIDPRYNPLLWTAFGFGLLVGITMLFGFLVWPRIRGLGEPYLTWSESSRTLTLPRQSRSVVVPDGTTPELRLIHGGTRRTDNAMRRSMCLFQAQVRVVSEESERVLPVLTHTSSGLFSKKILTDFATRSGWSIESIRVPTSEGPRGSDLAGMRFDEFRAKTD